MFSKILIANRGEIACRIVKTARRLGIKTVAVYSDADAKALHVRMADEAVWIGKPPSAESYLRGDAIIEAAKKTGVQAIHPGYGFLSENAAFAEKCAAAGITFIGPTPDAIRAMGLKDRAKDIMKRAGVPVVPGYQGDNQDPAFLQKEADKIGYPVLIKAVAGGGGKGMRRVDRAEDFLESLQSCQAEAQASFGNAHVLIEKYITKPRHIEVQVFGDSHGHAVHLFERDCSLQRRHQKVVEEAPAPDMPPKMRDAMGAAAVKAAQAIGYHGAGTIEFIADVSKGLNEKSFYFMEMNTRLQVEHPVTEMITGLDLVEWQLLVAFGKPLPLTQKELSINGHAFEVRLYAEDPANEFLPQIGKIAAFRHPAAARVDTGIESGDAVSIYYDPMIAKLIVHADTRQAAITKMRTALSETVLAGLNTNQEFLGNIFAHPEFIKGDVDTGFIPRFMNDLAPENYGLPSAEDLALAGAFILAPLPSNTPDPWTIQDNWRMNADLTRTLTFVTRGKHDDVTVTCQKDGFNCQADGKNFFIPHDQIRQALIAADGNHLTLVRGGRVLAMHLYTPGSDEDDAGGEGRILSPMPGKIVSVLVKLGDAVAKDQPLLVMEAMKMQMTIRAGCAGNVVELPVCANDQVQDGAVLAIVE
jgi:3-methylcrotonyl-CoA carboxylase alpha subunit